MDIPKTPGRKPRKQDKISEYLRNKIISGEWKAGEKIPSRAALEKQFKVSSVTIQRTLTPMIEDGFLRVVPNRGTFVNENPPHMLNYALVLPQLKHADRESRNLFFQTLRAEALKLQRELNIKIIPYDHALASPLSAAGIQLIKDIRAERLAGILFTTPLHLVRKSPMVHEKNIPRVVISTTEKDFPNVSHDSQSFIRKGLDQLEAAGRKHIAIMSTTGQYGNYLDSLIAQIKERGMTTYPEWHQASQLGSPESSTNIMRLLMSPHNSRRPDGLIVTDDNLTEAVCKGLELAEVKVPEDLHVVAHCNFPVNNPVNLPVDYIGFDSREVIKNCIQILQDMRAGKPVPELTKIQARTEAELKD